MNKLLPTFWLTIVLATTQPTLAQIAPMCEDVARSGLKQTTAVQQSSDINLLILLISQ